MFRLSTCTCPKCQNGKYNECDRDKIHGVWVKHSITKQGKVSTKANVTSYDSDYDDELQYATEEEDDKEDDGDRNQEDRLQKTIKYGSTYSEGDYVIVSWYQKQYIGKIWDINQSELEATCKFMRRDFSYIHDQKLKFKWPNVDDFQDIKDWNKNVLPTVLDYSLERRGGILIDSCIKEMFKNLN